MVHSYGPERRPRHDRLGRWEGPAGWVFVDEASRTADSAVRPDLRGGPAEELVVAHVEEQLGPGPISVRHVGRRRDSPGGACAALGYRLDRPIYQTFAIPSATPIDPPVVPDGFRLLDALTDEWVAERAECHHRAFDPSRDDARALRRVPAGARVRPGARRRSGRPRTVVLSRTPWRGRIAVSRTGQLEPVGTRPHFWRRGLGQRGLPGGVAAAATAGHRGWSGSTPGPGTRGTSPSTSPAGSSRTTTIDRWVRPG